jgi:hypothetical protein
MKNMLKAIKIYTSFIVSLVKGEPLSVEDIRANISKAEANLEYAKDKSKKAIKAIKERLHGKVTKLDAVIKDAVELASVRIDNAKMLTAKIIETAKDAEDRTIAKAEAKKVKVLTKGVDISSKIKSDLEDLDTLSEELTK